MGSIPFLSQNQRYALSTNSSGESELVVVEKTRGFVHLTRRWKVLSETKNPSSNIDVSLEHVVEKATELDPKNRLHLLSNIRRIYPEDEVIAIQEIWNRQFEGIEDIDQLLIEKEYNEIQSYVEAAAPILSENRLIEILSKVSVEYEGVLKGEIISKGLGSSDESTLDRLIVFISVEIAKKARKRVEAAAKGNDLQFLERLIKKEDPAARCYQEEISLVKEFVKMYKLDIENLVGFCNTLEDTSCLELLSCLPKERVESERPRIRDTINPLELIEEGKIEELGYFLTLCGNTLSYKVLNDIDQKIYDFEGLLYQDERDKQINIIPSEVRRKEIIREIRHLKRIFNKNKEERLKNAITTNDIEFVKEKLKSHALNFEQLKHFPGGIQAAAQEVIALCSPGIFVRAALKFFNASIDYTGAVDSILIKCDYYLLLSFLNKTGDIDRSQFNSLQFSEQTPLQDPNTNWPIVLDKDRMESSSTIGGKSSEEEKAKSNWIECERFARKLAIENRKNKGKIDCVKLACKFNEMIAKGLENNGGRPGSIREIDSFSSNNMESYVSPKMVIHAMDDFNNWTTEMFAKCDRNEVHPVEFAVLAYQRLVSIHPFIDANGRTAKMLMDYILVCYNLPPPAIGKNKCFAMFAHGSNLSYTPKKAVEVVVEGLNKTREILGEHN